MSCGCGRNLHYRGLKDWVLIFGFIIVTIGFAMLVNTVLANQLEDYQGEEQGYVGNILEWVHSEHPETLNMSYFIWNTYYDDGLFYVDFEPLYGYDTNVTGWFGTFVLDELTREISETSYWTNWGKEWAISEEIWVEAHPPMVKPILITKVYDIQAELDRLSDMINSRDFPSGEVTEDIPDDADPDFVDAVIRVSQEVSNHEYWVNYLTEHPDYEICGSWTLAKHIENLAEWENVLEQLHEFYVLKESS